MSRKTHKLSPAVKRGLERAERVVADEQAKSQQPRFDKKMDDVYVGMVKWAKEAFETIPDYQSDSRVRSKWLNQFWRNEPYLAGIINSVIQIDRNRGWELVGGRNQVLRFTDVLHNWQVQPGRASWRDGVSAMAQSFYTMDIGGLVEVGRMFKGGPMTGMYHLDATRCVLTSKLNEPLKYYPSRSTRTGQNVIKFAPNDYMRTVSQINIDEGYNGLGYSSLSRCVELAITMVAILRHEQEMLFARAPKGLLLLKGVSENTWANAMQVREAELDGMERQWFGSVAVLATAGVDDVDAKLVALSQLPEGFNQETFTDLLIFGYALAFGYDPREFWPVSANGMIGTATETAIQHRKATGKGGKEFALGFQEELQGNLPDTLHFEFEERDVDGERADAELSLAKVDVINALRGTAAPALISDQQALQLLAEEGVIPREWTEVEEDVEATDTEDADSPDNESADEQNAGDQPPVDQQDVERMMEFPEVQRALQKFPSEPVVVYNSRTGKVREVSRKYRKHFVMRADAPEVLHADGDVVITTLDVDTAIAGAKRRTPEMYDKLVAETKEQSEHQQSKKPLFRFLKRG